jgi:hypothetical protein
MTDSKLTPAEVAARLRAYWIGDPELRHLVDAAADLLTAPPMSREDFEALAYRELPGGDTLVPWKHKAARWDEARLIEDPAVIAATATFRVYDGPSSPLHYFPDEANGVHHRPQFHIVQIESQRFLVDTQGYDYARYIARLP